MGIYGIDMGHSLSGAGSGAVGIKKETDMNRLAGKRLIEMLKEKGHTVYNCTVDSASSVDNQLIGIVNKANAQNLDVFVSLHLNSFGDSSANGVETYIYNGSWNGKEANRAIAKKVNDELVNRIGWYNRGVKEANYYVLRATKAPAILVELGFCSNANDMNKWNTENIAKAIFKALTGNEYTTTTTTTTTSTSTSTATSGSYLVKVNTDVLNVRAGAGTSYKVTTTVKQNQVYTIVETKGNWGKLKSGAGWICLDYTVRC